MNKFKPLVWCIFGTLLAAIPLHVWFTMREQELHIKVSSLRVEAQLAQEAHQQLLSKGRFVRTYDPKTNSSIYKFYVSNRGAK